MKELRKIADGYTAQIFEWHAGQVLKLYFPEFTGIAEKEFTIMQKILELGLPAPKVFEIVEINGRAGYVLERIVGSSYRDLLEDDLNQCKKLAITLAKAHAQIHDIELCSASMTLEPILPRILDRIKAGSKKLQDFSEVISLSLNQIKGGNSLVHNDFHFGNILNFGKEIKVIDWNGAGLGDRCADVAKSAILMNCAPPGLCFGPKTHKHRQEIVRIYLESYDKESPLDNKLLSHWKIIRAAEIIGLKVPFSDKLEKEIKRLI